MSSPFIGEIRMFAGNFAPAGWAMCDGQLIPISENDALFNLIGTTYGGDGQSTFALPNLQGRVAAHVGPGFALGQVQGTEAVTLNTNQLPAHSHPWPATTNPAQNLSPVGFGFATSVGNFYNIANPTAVLAAGTIGADGGSQPHENMMRYTVVNFIISLFGVFPFQ